jgi:hypothetical protein
MLKVSRAAILRGWLDKKANLWWIPLVPIVLNNNTETVPINKPPTEFLPNRPPPIEAIHNVNKLKTQPELVQYLHALAGFPTKPTWIEAIKNNHNVSWPGLTVNAVTKHFPESKETMKGHGQKGKSGLQFTKPTEPIIKIEPGTITKLTSKHQRRRTTFSLTYSTSRRKQSEESTPTSQAVSQRDRARETNILWC